MNNPWTDLLLLLVVTFGFSLLVQLPLVFFAIVLTGDMGALSSEAGTLYGINPYFTYLLFIGGTLGTFLLPAYYFYRRNKHYSFFPTEQSGRPWLFVLPILFLLAFAPLMSLVAEWNMQMTLPEGLKSIEEWMYQQETNMNQLMARVIMVDRIDLLLLNLLAIAILPAIGEEFFFRGALQHIFKRIFHNEYVAIWVVAIIFSAIHVQFYGFFPRMLLGVFFGYMLVWTRNIWVPIVAHFVNNATIVLMAFYYATQGKSYAELSASESFPIIAYLGSLILSIGLAYLFYQYTKKTNYMEKDWVKYRHIQMLCKVSSPSKCWKKMELLLF